MIEWKYREDHVGEIVMCVDGDVKLRFASIHPAGMGMPVKSRERAKEIVEWLNSRPQKDTVLYPYQDYAE